MFLLNCVVLICSHLVPHSLSLKLTGSGQERVISMVYVGHYCSMYSGSCVPVPQGRSMDGEILRRCRWKSRRQRMVLSRKMIVCCHLSRSMMFVTSQVMLC